MGFVPYRNIESQNQRGWKKPLKPSSPTFIPALLSPSLNYVSWFNPGHHVYMVDFKLLQNMLPDAREILINEKTSFQILDHLMFL